MPGVFLDSSALVKPVAVEPETEALLAYLGEPRRPVVVASRP
jgi:hypothetical protein